MKPITERPSSEPSAAAILVLALHRGYKLLISPYFAGSCRFLPSCSEYARDAVLRHGAARGGWLAAKRLMKCHPLGSSGFDPVPGYAGRSRLREGYGGPPEQYAKAEGPHHGREV